LIEGLDCSGKKTVGSIVERYFSQPGRHPVRCQIGPLVSSPLRLIDDRLTHTQRMLRRGQFLDFVRRATYLAGPVIDGVLFRPNADFTSVKISSHYRAQARALTEGDYWMSRWFSRLERISISFGGCAYLTVPFDVRIARHRTDAATGRTAKVEARRFINHDEAAFSNWDRCLFELLARHIPHVLTVLATGDINEIAQQVIKHIEHCRRIGAIA
jgi:thymidylate kinase